MSYLGCSAIRQSKSHFFRQSHQIKHKAALASFQSTKRWSSASTSAASPSRNDQRRLPLTLYRQLLDWCRNTEAAIPLEAFIEPISLAPPQLDSDKLQELQQRQNDAATDTSIYSLVTRVHGLLPKLSRVESDSLLVRVQSTQDLKKLVRAMFRLNSETSDEKDRKTRITFAFQTLRSLNELSLSLDELKRHRDDHLDRGDDVLFYCGQTVQHKHERWRGVIVGWERPTKVDDDDDKAGRVPTQLTSLTTKTYKASDFLKSVRYEVILDAGDVNMMEATSSFIVATQDDLEPLSDRNLCHIRNVMITDHFERFDPFSCTFKANELLAYEYPADHALQLQFAATARREKTCDATDSPEVIADRVISEIRRFSQYLETLIDMPEICNENQETFALLASIKAKIASVSFDQVGAWPPSILTAQHEGMTMEAQDFCSPIAIASARIRQLLNVSLIVRDILLHRESSKQAAPRLKFDIGDVIYHKGFGFRGVVVAFDEKPTIDVSRWDGLVDIENPLEKPFYHVLPDQQDCINVFGEERGMRYICENNMDVCHADSRALTVALDQDWKRKLSSEGSVEFIPPLHIQFKHGMDIGDEGLTEFCLEKLQTSFTQWFVASRELEGNNRLRLSLEDLFGLLEATERMEDAIALEEVIKEIFKSHVSEDARRKLEGGISNLLLGKNDDAFLAFSEVAEKHSDYAEAWNKIAACEYMAGKFEKSLDAAKKALDLMPLHFQAYNGKGLCEYNQSNYSEAAASFRKSLELDPWSPVSSKLAACIDILNRKNQNSS